MKTEILVSGILSLWLIAFSEGVGAASYYVSPTGSASWSQCTNINTPCSAETAMQNAHAGDIVYFRGGKYELYEEEDLFPYHTILGPANSGNPGNPITFKAYPGEIPVLNGNIWVKATGTADEGSDNYTLVDNDADFIQAGVSSWDIVRTAHKEGGAPVSSVQDAHTVILSEAGVHNSIDLKPGDVYTIGKDTVTILSNNYQDYIVFDGFVLQADNGEENAKILIKGPETYDRAVGNVVRNCIIIGGTRKIVHGDNREGLRIDNTNNTLVQNCLIYGQKSINNNHNTGAIKMYHNFNTTIENCEFTNTTLAIFDKSDSENSTYKYNYIHDCDRAILFTGYAWTGFVSNHRNIKVHDNLIARCGGIGDTEQEWADSDNMEVHDNILYSDGNTYTGIGLGVGRKKVYNNIIYGSPRDYDLGILRFLSGEYENGTRRSISILASDHNFFGDIEGSFCVRTIKPDSNGELVYTTYWNLPDWQSSHELDSPIDVGCGFSDNPGCGSIVGNPKFLNSSGTMSKIEDFKLAPDSPCKGAGRNGDDIGADIDLVGIQNSQNQTETPICEATTGNCYYADNHTNGNCSFQNPCNISTALSKMSAGDYLYLLGGVYSDFYSHYSTEAIINLDKYFSFNYPEPTRNNPVTIKSYPRQKAVIKGDYSKPCIWVDGNSNIIFEGLDIQQCWEAGIKLQEDADVSNIIIRNCTFHEIVCNDNMGGVYVGGADNVVIDRNEFYDCYYQGTKDLLDTPQCRGSAMHFFRATNITISNNNIHHTCSGMYYKHGEPVLGSGGYTKIINNTWRDLYGWCIGINQNRAELRNNLLIGCGINLYQEDGTAGPFLTGVAVENNTIINGFVTLNRNSDARPTYLGAVNTTIKNNILFNSSYNIWVYGSDEQYYRGINLISDNNCFYRPSGEFLVNYFGNNNPAYGGENTGGYYPLDDWKSLGFDLHSIEADPMFVDFSSRDFHLKNESPCKGMGAYSSGTFISSQCTSQADADLNGIITTNELIHYINRWFSNQGISLIQVVQAIREWKRGCGE